MPSAHSIRARALALAAAGAVGMLGAQTPRAQTPTPATSNFVIFLRSVPIGNEQVSVERTADGWTIAASGRVGPPVDLIIRSLRARYDAEWRPVDLTLDATLRGQASTLHTAIAGTTATNETTPFGAAPVTKSDQIDARSVLLPNPFIAPYEALAARLKTAPQGSTIPIYQPALSSFDIEVGTSSMEQIKTIDRIIDARRTRLTFRVRNAPPMALEIWGDENGRLLRVSIPAQSLEVAREDVAAVSARLVTMSRPNDEDVFFPANGFSLAGTISRPANSAGPLPVVILISGSGQTDRDESLAGIPIFGQIAHVLADAGFMVVRYDKRGIGQSGGRTEAARLADFAEDGRAVVRAISARKDVNRRRIALVGHGEGGWIAMMVAAKENRVAAVGLLSTAGATGRDVNLYQVRHGLERSSRPQAEQLATIELQRQIQQAVITGSGWERIDIPAAVRRQADTPYFQSFLTHDPATIMKDVDQPVLIVHGERDTQIPPTNAERLEALARARKKSTVEAVTVPGINHLLIPAATGEVDEYGRLTDRQVSPAVTTALIDWLRRSLGSR